MRIAVVGSGVAGLGAAWALSRRHDVTVFEAEARLGGHANTLDVAWPDGTTTAVDTGFIVYNPRNYPYLIRLFDQIGAPTEGSDMSFAVSLDQGRLEYAGSPIGLVAQPSNVLKPSYWAMVRQILRFYKEAPALLALDPEDPAAMQALGDYLQDNGYGDNFTYNHLLPMAAAIWSCPVDAVMRFPVRSFVQFLDNHGLMLIRGRPQWRTVAGGSREYVQRIADAVGHERFHTNAPVRALRRSRDGVTLFTDAGPHHFDQVVLATHGDQALRILGDDASDAERQTLGAFTYEANQTYLHSDPTLMPRRRAVWSSWNYIGDGTQDASAKVSVTYWMNRLQNLPGRNLFVSLNPLTAPAPDTVHAEMAYTHPVFDGPAIAAQGRLPYIQGAYHTWFCGSYCGYGFHEDGLEAGLAVASALGAPPPWSEDVTPASPAARCADGAQPTPQAAAE
ncbi:NAD(P)/FAD-dependent oxidoreductase [Rhodovibrio salinarum]|uniref:NAD/FAD-binding protein n=1 Tax=Rhodovibrio salinarum TaxID=1087 RepID=A0A934QIY3_9PROT|nr:FAD-dependent oxidoreductase [Rhodovibrio salinarum]MBK1697577.1 NAD/FAD-binding protein [Rhodovibrio salinarum]